MKLYVWVNPYDVDYGSSMVFAVADNLTEARKQARNGTGFAFGDCPDKAPTKLKLGKPDRVTDLPCAEWHMWSE